MDKFQTTCPHCCSDKVRLTNIEPLFVPNMAYYRSQKLTETEQKELYQWDEEIYAKAFCDNCQTPITVEGKIHWNV